tara:strand:- start:5462 stop:7282 length:1821 start_codon:yes stop_codon:yes gene_type:complete
MTDLFQVREDLKIGRVIEVSGNGVRIELDNKISELTRSVDGRVYPVGQLGSMVKINFGRKVLFAYVRMLRMRSDIVAELNINAPLSDDTRILEVDLFGQGEWNRVEGKLAFNRGVEIHPLPQQDVFLCLSEELEKIYIAAEQLSAEHVVSPMIAIGTYVGSNNAICRTNIDKMFGHHCAILGSTGSGKSGTVAAILHAVLASSGPANEAIQPKIVIIDPHGEYAKAFTEKAEVYCGYNESSTGDLSMQQLDLPYWLMSTNEFRALVIGKTEHEATSQNNMIFEAVSYARLLNQEIVENISENPEGGSVLNPTAGFDENTIMSFDRDRPIPFCLSDVENHLEMQGRKLKSTDKLAPSNDIRIKVDSILRKMRVLKSNPQLSFVMQEYKENGSKLLSKILAQFLCKGIDVKPLRIIDISGLPNEVAGVLTALIARLLFQYKFWQTPEQRRMDPILFVCEEAHRYVPNHGEAQYREAQQAIRRIAKEGRKYGLGLMLVSQRPSDVESTVLSQCNSWIVLRLTNAHDQEHVAKFLPDNLIGLTKMLPSLTRREAIFIGEAAALPSRIKINKLPKTQLPDSHDISYIEAWVAKPASYLIDTVTARWLGHAT